MEMSGQPHALATLSLGKKAPNTHWIGARVGPRASLGHGGKEKKSLP